MAKRYDSIPDSLRDFIAQQKLFFVATAAQQGRVNLSPKGMDSLRILDANHLLWLNLTGSGNETAAHLQESSRMTIMFCAFEGSPMILRLYGHARTVFPEDGKWEASAKHFQSLLPGVRQIIDMEIDLVQTSCGMGVPLFDYKEDRESLQYWAQKKGRQGVEAYWEEKNRVSLDGKPIRFGRNDRK